jgi:hypothetical protein
MKVKLLTGRVGTGFSQEPGQVIDLPDGEARRMIQSLQAEPATDTKPPGGKPPHPSRK